MYRRSIFTKNVRLIHEHNRKKLGWKHGINQFTDMMPTEFRRLLRSKFIPREDSPGDYDNSIKDLPLRCDWRDRDVITPVKNQGMCGSWWAFAAAEGIESQYAIVTSKLVELSEQEILDCYPDISGGCDGGYVELAYKMLMQMGGISSEWTYPYTSFYGENYACNISRFRPIVKILNYLILRTNTYYDLIYSLYTIGPVQVQVDSSSWHFYKSGIFDGCNKTNTELNHAVQLVGIGVDNITGQEYWIVRNTWGVDWGENGYIRLFKRSNFTCALQGNIRVCGTCGIQYQGIIPIVN